VKLDCASINQRFRDSDYMASLAPHTNATISVITKRQNICTGTMTTNKLIFVFSSNPDRKIKMPLKPTPRNIVAKIIQP